jgi:hypothetical protein
MRRNTGIIGAPDSGASEVFQALVKFSTNKKWREDSGYVSDGAALCDGLSDWTELTPPPYNSTQRTKLFDEIKKEATK